MMGEYISMEMRYILQRNGAHVYAINNKIYEVTVILLLYLLASDMYYLELVRRMLF